MTIHTPIESPGLVDKKYIVFKKGGSFGEMNSLEPIIQESKLITFKKCLSSSSKKNYLFGKRTRLCSFLNRVILCVFQPIFGL